MSRTHAEVSIFDRLFLLPEEAGSPDRRFTKSLFLFVLTASAFLEGFLGAVSLFSGHLAVGALHLLLASAVLASLTLFKAHFVPWAFTLVYLLTAWTSSTISLTSGLGLGTLMWHFLVPTGVLILMGEKWGWAALAGDLALALVHGLWFLPLFTVFGSGPIAPGLLLGTWEVGAALLFLLFLLLLRMVQRTLDAYRVERGQALDQLSQTRNSEARWADQARFLETLMDVIPFPIFHKGNDGRYLSANASFRVVFDVAKEAVTGQTNEAFLLAENAKTLAKVELDVLARDSMAVEETVLIHADGLPHDFIVYLMPFVDDAMNPLGSIGVLIDITDRKLREDKLEKLNATKDQLFSIISHDLRGPVGKLKQLLDIYMDDPGIFNKATWDQVFHDMRRSADSLFQLLENLLSWARSQQGHGEVRYESVAIEPLIGDIFAVLKLLAADKKISLETDLKLAGPLLTDRHVLATIVRNLVHNALKFTAPGGKITVSAGETTEDLWIEVKDTGLGMSEEVLHRIFQKKERMTTYGTAKERGQGIGLGLCQDLAETLGAHLEATSQLGSGTSIRLHLPTPEL